MQLNKVHSLLRLIAKFYENVEHWIFGYGRYTSSSKNFGENTETAPNVPIYPVFPL